MTRRPLLELRQVGKVFPGRGRQAAVVALDGVDLSLEAGEFVSLVGASGSGKSTLINLVAGFVPPSSGTVTVHGAPVRAPGPDRVVVFQDHAVFPWFTALDNVAYGLRRRGLGRAVARRFAGEALDRMGLGDFRHAYPATLSGGMRQRVALARALVLRPEILLLDEPFAALDAGTRAGLQDVLLALWRQCGWSVLFVTHVLDEAVYLADRVVVLDRPPVGVRAVERVDVPRPRRRRDGSLAAQTERLRSALPGCLAAVGAG